MIKQKRGASVLVLFRAASFMLLGVALLCLISIGGMLTKTTYEKNFIARNVALLIDAVYASPGDLEYTYDISVHNWKGQGFDLEIKEGHVIVYDPGFRGPQSYRFAEKQGYEIEEFKAEAPSAVKFVKRGNKIEIRASYLG